MLALAACGPVADPGDADGPASELDGAWHLVAGRDADGPFPLGGHEVTLLVDGEEASGRSACNSYMATVAVGQGGEGSVAFSGIGGTEMGCEPAVMQLEQRYVDALGAVEDADRGAQGLTLSGPDVRLDLELDPPVRDAALVGTTWTIEALLDGVDADDSVSSVLPGGHLTLDATGSLSGSTGCRGFRAGWTREGDRVQVEGLEEDAATGVCADAAETQHRHVLAVLRDGFTADVDGDVLVLVAAGGQGLQLRVSG